MKEASLFRYYFARYFFLAFAMLQALAALILLLRYQDSPKIRFAIFVFCTLAMMLMSLHLFIFAKVKRVAVGKKKIAVIDNYKLKRYTWEEVKELKLIYFLNLYSLKLKGKKNRIYFLPATNSQALFGLFNERPDFLREHMSKA
jgi:hypothetical protein